MTDIKTTSTALSMSEPVKAKPRIVAGWLLFMITLWALHAHAQQCPQGCRKEITDLQGQVKALQAQVSNLQQTVEHLKPAASQTVTWTTTKYIGPPVNPQIALQDSTNLPLKPSLVSITLNQLTNPAKGLVFKDKLPYTVMVQQGYSAQIPQGPAPCNWTLSLAGTTLSLTSENCGAYAAEVVKGVFTIEVIP